MSDISWLLAKDSEVYGRSPQLQRLSSAVREDLPQEKGTGENENRREGNGKPPRPNM